jgi:hypothetical protein
MDVWIGSGYSQSANRILVLGESWYGDVEPLAVYVPRWVRGEVIDNTFARIFNAASGCHTESASQEQRTAWWNSIAFYNFVPGSVGASRSDRPSPAAYIAAAGPLAVVLDQLRPRGVWILGKGQAEYSVGVVERSGIACEVSTHPTGYGVRSEELKGSWAKLSQRVKAI